MFLRIQEGNKRVGMLENMQFLWEIFTLSPVAYIPVDFQKMVSIHAGSTLLESECIKRKTRLDDHNSPDA